MSGELVTVSGVLVASCLLFRAVSWLLKLLAPVSVRRTRMQLWKWTNVTGSLVHSSITGCGSCILFYVYPDLAADVINARPFCARALVALSIGYFIHDSVDMVRNNLKKTTYELLVHHFFVISCFGLSVVSGYYLGYSVVALVVEVNSVFLHTRQMMIVQGVSKHSQLYRFNSLLTVSTFMAVRIPTLGWMTRWLVVNRDAVPLATYTLGSVALATLVLMNIVLFLRILHSDYRRVDAGTASTAPSTDRTSGPNRLNSALRQLVRGTEEEEVFPRRRQ